MTIHPKLFKRDTKGNIRVWYMTLGTDDGLDYYHQTVSGILDGAEVVSGKTYVEEKNSGKKNATTKEEQALKEVKARYDIQKEQGYTSDINSVDTVAVTSPMLAEDYNKDKNRKKVRDSLKEGVYSQPKLDGIRATVSKDGIFTRNGKRIESCNHILSELQSVFQLYPGITLDGELYNHEYKDDFNTITSVVRKSKIKKEDEDKAKSVIQYHIYDALIDDMLFVDRITLITDLDVNSDIIRKVPTVLCTTEDVLDNMYAKYLSEGYEGQMVRINDYYHYKRTSSLLKRKEFFSEEFSVVAVEEGQGNWGGAVKRFVLRLPDGRSFEAGVRGTYEQMQALLASPMKPTWATVRYFTPTPDGIPRFGVVVDYGTGERND